jgi:phenylacetate-CoA ligase
MVTELLSTNAFYRKKLGESGIVGSEDVTPDTLSDVPFTTKGELSDDQAEHPRFGTNLTYPLEDYVRVHQTSGTTGKPLRWLDDGPGWAWFVNGWVSVFRAAGVTEADRVFFAFGFGPFIGFWSAFDGCQRIGALAIPGGTMDSVQRLRAILDNRATVICCTPTYALRLAEVAEADGIDLAGSEVRVTIHGGEPGAGIPATRARIEAAWGATCYDHAGATEVGPWGFECREQAGLHLNEESFIFEVIDPDTGTGADEGELVITNLGRVGSPVLRYRTGDRVRLHGHGCGCGRTFRRLEGGVIGRMDDVLIVRGVNVYPSAIENVVRACDGAGEFAVDVFRRGTMDDLEIRVEAQPSQADSVCGHVSRTLRDALALRAKVEAVSPGSLPRFELKAHRVHDHREDEAV